MDAFRLVPLSDSSSSSSEGRSIIPGFWRFQFLNIPLICRYKEIFYSQLSTCF